MKKVFIIIASQEYDSANHKGLWHELAKNASNDEIIVVNIPADYFITVFKGKKYRITEAKAGVKILAGNMLIIRPMFLVRPEILPEFLCPFVAKRFWKIMKKSYPQLEKSQVNLLIYDAKWVRILADSRKNLKIAYYLYDEVRYLSSNNQIDKKSYRLDEFACRKSDVVFAMSKMLADSRQSLQKNTIVIGNGANEIIEESPILNHFNNSIAFIGRFRDWIDINLFNALIEKRRDLMFYLLGPIEEEMLACVREMLNKHENLLYCGCVEKNKMPYIYKMFDAIIIPYKQNDFMKATRPIKIVESIIAGVPVVTIPVSGYDVCSFIRFATDVDSFSKQIDYVLNNPINKESDEYTKFISDNTWKTKAKVIIDNLK